MRPEEPSGPWALRLPRGRVDAAAALRGRAGVRVLPSEDEVWLGGDHLDEALDRLLRRLPGERYRLGGDRRLFAPGARVPSGRLPEGTWQALEAWMTPAPQPPAFAGAPPEAGVAVGLVRDDAERPARVLQLEVEAFAAWATAAPQVRLAPLRFAACADGRVLVRGHPLPALPGPRFAERDGVAIPCGYAIAPAVGERVLASALGLQPDDLALLLPDGGLERIPAESWVALCRSAARRTLREVRGA